MAKKRTWWQLNAAARMNDLKKWVGGTDARSRKAVREHVILNNYKSLLDVGCGLGIELDGYKEAGYDLEYTGTDTAKPMLDQCREKGIKAVNADVRKLPWGDNKFDAVYCRHLLEHLEDGYEQALSEMIRVASKEVIVVFFTPMLRGGVDVMDVDRNLNGEMPLNSYSLPKLEAFLKNYRVTVQELGMETILHIEK